MFQNLIQDSIESKNELLKAQREQEFLESLNQIKTAKLHDESSSLFVEINHEGYQLSTSITDVTPTKSSNQLGKIYRIGC